MPSALRPVLDSLARALKGVSDNADSVRIQHLKILAAESQDAEQQWPFQVRLQAQRTLRSSVVPSRCEATRTPNFFTTCGTPQPRSKLRDWRIGEGHTVATSSARAPFAGFSSLR
jgi:hypothetical protein